MSRPRILVVGAVHPDALGSFDSLRDHEMDKPGSVKLTVGGTGFNVAYALRERHRVDFVSAVHGHTFFGRAVRRVLADAKIRLVASPSRRPTDGGFVAHYRGGELVGAVTESTLEDATLDPALEKLPWSRYAVAVVDCNLSPRQLRVAWEHANRAHVPVVVCGVSEFKALRWRETSAFGSTRASVFSLNEAEAKVVLQPRWTLDDLATPEIITEACKHAGTERLVITRGSSGYLVFSLDGTRNEVPAPVGIQVASSSGAGDALVAGIVESLAVQKQFELPDARRRISWHVEGALARLEPNALPSQTLYQKALARLGLWDFPVNRPGKTAWALLVVIATMGDGLSYSAQFVVWLWSRLQLLG